MSEMTESLFRLRVAYEKRGRLAYLGHLEVLHTVERIVRRAEMPYAVTQGFSPHMRCGFSSALPVGTSSEAEYYDLFLTELVEPRQALERLRAASPADLAPYAVAYLDVRAPALTAAIVRVDYTIDLALSEGVTYEALEAALTRVSALVSIPYLRGKKEKTLDMAWLQSFALTRAERGARLTLESAISNEGSLRPEILLAAIDRELSPESYEGPIVSTGLQDLSAISRYSVYRTAQWIADDAGAYRSPMGEHVQTHAKAASVSSRTCE